MAKELRFFIIAGPNGAGKTTLGRALVPADVSIFNGDLVFEQLCKQYPDIDPERLKGGVPVALEKARDTAMSEGKDFAFETNFSSGLTMDLANQFKEKGYDVNLIYLGLDNPTIAASRVKTRVSLGGHDIPLETIYFNFYEGIKGVKNNLSFFATNSFFNSTVRPALVASFDKNARALLVFDISISWFNQHFKQSLENLAVDIKIKQTRSTKTEELPKRKRGRRL
ncbi:MAG: hypothetical protein HOP08_08595 [Cyclobacteriaceae bacterium]|nr:hypothetical protein [Cyclobacteriaceae bacterium]